MAFWTAFLAFGSRLPTPLVSFFLVYVARTIEHFGAQYTSTPQRSGRQKTAASWPGIVRFAKCICRSIIRPPLHMRGPWSGALGSTRFASRTPSVFLSFFLYNTLSFPLYFPGKTAWKSSNFGSEPSLRPPKQDKVPLTGTAWSTAQTNGEKWSKPELNGSWRRWPPCSQWSGAQQEHAAAAYAADDARRQRHQRQRRVLILAAGSIQKRRKIRRNDGGWASSTIKTTATCCTVMRAHTSSTFA